MKKTLLLIIAIYLAAAPASADTIILNNGKTIEGKITNETVEKIQINLGVGVPITYYKSDIKNITHESDVAQSSANEKRSLKKAQNKPIIQERLKNQDINVSVKRKPDHDISILFIGNSHTAANSLGFTLAAMAKSDGLKLKHSTISPGGVHLKQHLGNMNTLDKINKNDWDYVVLQEQSWYPLIKKNLRNSTIPSAKKLSYLIRQNGAQPVIFMLWGFRNGFSQTKTNSYSSMQRKLIDVTKIIASESNAAIAPVGLAWQKALKSKPKLDLWEQDGIHPNKAGSYLAACVFYKKLFKRSPVGLYYPESIGKNKAAFLQKIANKL